MAARQDQTQTIISITFAVLFLIMSIVAYLAWSESKKNFASAEEAQRQKSEAENAARKKVNETEVLAAMVGFDQGAPFDTMQEKFESDKTQFMSTLENASYQGALEYIFEENARVAQQENVAKTQVKKLEQDLIALKAEWEKQLAEERKKADEAKRDLAAERTRFEQEREAIDRQKRQLAQTLARKEGEFKKMLASVQEERDAIRTESDKKARALETLIDNRKSDSPSSEVADGRITYVNQASQTAWIDLGEKDSLRRQVTFSVFAAGLTDAARADKKGSLEVIRILGDHIAEAKITSDDPRDPILPGDRVYSQVWERGKVLRFGLTGFIDFEGDGSSDLQRAKDLIALNGGVVDVSLEEDGQIDGEMSVGTRYLVLGDSPTQPSKSVLREKYQTMSKEAASLGVETITLVDFLNRMGFHSTGKAQRLAGGSSAGRSGGGRPTSYRFTP